MTTTQIAYPMEKLQRQVRSLVEKNILKPSDRIGKIALLYGDNWVHWRKELQEFDFAMQDPISELLDVEGWDED
jgi:Domain of unknown function (DUF4327)